MIKTLSWIILVVPIITLMVLKQFDFFPEMQRITVASPSTLQPLAQEIADRFSKQNPNIKVQLQIEDNDQSILDVRDGLYEISFVNSEPKVEDSDLFWVKMLSSTKTNDQTVQSLLQNINILTNNPPEGATEKFIKYAQSSEVQDLVKKYSPSSRVLR